MSGEPEVVSASAIAPTTLPVPTAPAASSAATMPATPAVAVPASSPAGELDAKGTPFDSAKHLPKKSQHGRWMPRSTGRKKSAASSTAGNGAAGYPPAAPATPPPPSFIPAKEPAAPAPEAGTGEPAKPAEPAADHSEDAAEVAAEALQFTAGVVLDSHTDCACSPAEHKSMVRAFAAYIRVKGWQATAGVATLLVVAAYLLRTFRKDKPHAVFSGWFRKPAPKNVTPVADAPAAPATPAPAAPPAPKQNAVILDIMNANE